MRGENNKKIWKAAKLIIFMEHAGKPWIYIFCNDIKISCFVMNSPYISCKI